MKLYKVEGYSGCFANYEQDFQETAGKQQENSIIHALFKWTAISVNKLIETIGLIIIIHLKRMRSKLTKLRITFYDDLL